MTKLGGSTTAIEALRGADLSGKVAVVTGGNSGIGVETVYALAAAGAHVISTARNVEVGQKVADEITARGIKGKITVQKLDLASLRDVETAAADIAAATPAIDYLILNAGVMGGPGKTKDGFELTTGTNHIGHFYLTKKLLPKLKSQGRPVRIVVVASATHTFPKVLPLDDLNWEKRKYSVWTAYGQSKLCNILFASELAHQAKEAGDSITAFSLHPGVIQTALLRTSFLERVAMKVINSLYVFTKSPAQGAATSVYAAVAPELEVQSGVYLVDCKAAKTSALASDAQLAKDLWAKTEELIADALKN